MDSHETFESLLDSIDGQGDAPEQAMDSPDTDIVSQNDTDTELWDETSVSPRYSGLSTFASFMCKCGINMVLPFINGVMLGFGEIFAHEIGFRYHWAGAKVSPARRMIQRDEQDLKEKNSVMLQ